MKHITIILKATGQIKSGAQQMIGKLRSFMQQIKQVARAFVQVLGNLQAGFRMVQNAVQKMSAFMHRAFRFETMTVHFKTLIGNIDEARKHMKDVQEMGLHAPFSLEEFAAASRALMVMTDGALGFRDSLKMAGDVAAATGQPIQNVAHEIGKAFACVRDGQPVTRAAVALQNMGAITPDTAKHLADMQQAGAGTAEIWKELEGALIRHTGTMDEVTQTAAGTMQAISAEWDNTLRELATAVLETCKDGLHGLLDWMKELREDGTVAVWANRTGETLNGIAAFCKKRVEWLAKAKRVAGRAWDYYFTPYRNAYKGFKGWAERSGAAVGAWIGTRFNGGSARDAWNAGKQAAAETAREQEIRKAEADMERIREGEREQQIRENARKRAAVKHGTQVDEGQRIRKALEEGQRKIEERIKAEIEMEAQAMKDAQCTIANAVIAERMAEINSLRNAKANRQAENAEAQKRLQAATQNEAQAWSLYRNKDQWKAQLEDEKANAEAEKQFEKDFEHLKRFRKGWRTADNLSLDEEAVRRVGLAREQCKAAEQYARQTAESWEKLAEGFEYVERAIKEGGAK